MTPGYRTLAALVAAGAFALAAGDIGAQATARGAVFVDANANGVRDRGERGLAGVAVSNQDTVVVTDSRGGWAMARAGSGVVFVSIPDGYRAVGPFWKAMAPNDAATDFALAPQKRRTRFTFLHGSDTHVAPAVMGRMQRFRAIADSVRPEFVLITGDLVRDALRVGEAEATGYYDLFTQEVGRFRTPVWTVPGNHEVFGIERERSRVATTHPLYGREMYRKYRGPDYYSFTWGGIHFVGLNTVDIADQWYYGHVDSLQLAWLARDLAVLPAGTPVVTFNHIPFFTSVETVNGYVEGPPAPTLITVRGKASFRHAVSNARDVLAVIGGSRHVLALGGHMHTRERLAFDGIPTRFHQAAAVVGPSGSPRLAFPSGVTLYRVRDGVIDEGTFIPVVTGESRP